MPSRIKGCLLGVAIGDALGMPVELWSHEKILEVTEGQGITTFINPLQTRITDTKDLQPGQTTDDWQLTEVVARSIVECKGWNREHVARAHINAMKTSNFGWGFTTRDSIKALSQRDSLWDFPPDQGPGKGCGNGVVMKIAPLAIYSYLHYREVNQQVFAKHCMELGSLTHPDPRASFAAYGVALFLGHILQGLGVNKDNGLSILSHVISEVRDLEAKYCKFRPNPETVSERLSMIPRYLGSAEELRLGVGSKFFALDTAAFAIGVFLRNPWDFRKGVLEAVNAGGDTDTNASVVGALIGANNGIYGIPKEWRGFRPEYKEIENLAEELYLVGIDQSK